MEKEVNSTRLISAYNNLSVEQKEELRKGFLQAFDFDSRDTFYKKLNADTKVKRMEAQWFSAKLNIPVDELFSAEEQGLISADDIKEYGNVEVCGIVDDMFQVKITAFDQTPYKTLELMKSIFLSVGHIYGVVDKCVTEKGLFIYQLKKSEA